MFELKIPFSNFTSDPICMISVEASMQTTRHARLLGDGDDSLNISHEPVHYLQGISG